MLVMGDVGGGVVRGWVKGSVRVVVLVMHMQL